MISRRKSLSATDIFKKSLKIVSKIKELAFYKSSKVLALYFPFKNEVDLLELLNDDEKIFCFPKVRNDSKVLDFFVVKDVKDLKKGAFGILEPLENAKKVAIADIELFLVPGVGFSKTGERIGYGGGFYDSTLKQKSQSAIALGVAFDCQIVEPGFSEDFDIFMDGIVTETETKMIN